MKDPYKYCVIVVNDDRRFDSMLTEEVLSKEQAEEKIREAKKEDLENGWDYGYILTNINLLRYWLEDIVEVKVNKK